MNFVIYGDERLLMDDKLKELKERYHCSTDDMNYSVYDPSENSMSMILEDLRTLPFLTDYKMVVITHPLFLTSSKQKEVSEQDLKAFIDYIEQDNPTSILVIFHEGTFDERRKVMKSLRKHAQVFQMEKMDSHSVYKVTREMIMQKGAKIDNDALNLLLSRTGDNLFEISHQVEKLTLYTQHIRMEDVDALVAAPLEENVFALTNAILAHDMAKTMGIYKDLMVTNHEPIALIALIATSLRHLYEVKLLSRKGYNDREIAKMTGINPRAIYPIRKNGEKFEINELLAKLNELSQLDVKIKTGLIDKQRGLELFLLHMG